jgi:glycosyltransferase involved in cell wall biosynthesis
MMPERKMKVAFVPQPLDMIFPPMQSSIGIWTFEVARRLAPSCEVTVYSGRLRRKAKFDQGVLYRHLSVNRDQWLKKLLVRFSGIYSVKRPLFASGLYYFGYARRVASDLRKRRCDIVHLHNLSQFIPVIRALNPRIKIVLHMHCEWLTQLDPAMIQRRLRAVDLIIGCSEYITKKIRTAFPQIADRCHVVHNGVDINHFCGHNGRATPKAAGTERLLFVGRVSPEKGVHVLIDAFCEVVHRHPKLQLEIVGPEAQPPVEFIIALSDDSKVSALAPFYERRYLAQLRARLPVSLSNYVSFTGPVPYAQLIDHYRAAGMFVFPSVCHEAFGMPILEAMACQVPVVATRSGGIPEIVEDGKTGLLVERGDAAALAVAILHLLANEDLRQTMGKAARQRVLERFGWERVAGELFCRYEGMLDKMPSLRRSP